jgi:hypothetical protein
MSWVFAITKVKGRGEGGRESNSTEIVEEPRMCTALENRFVLEICLENKARTRRRTRTKTTSGLTGAQRRRCARPANRIHFRSAIANPAPPL